MMPGDPADAAFRQADRDVGEAHRDLRVEPVDRAVHAVRAEQHRGDLGRRVGRGRRRRARRADVQAQHGLGLRARREERIPVAGVDRRQPELVGRLGERDGLEAARRVAADLVGRDLAGRAGTRSGSGRSDPGCAPHHASRCQSLYARIAASASSSSSGHSVSRWPTKPGRNDGKHSDAHTPSMSMSATRAFDVPRAAPHLVEARRLEAVLARRPADHRVEADVRAAAAPCQTHASPPSSVATTRGASSANLLGKRPVNASGGSTTWSSTEITVYTRSRGSGSGSHVICSRRPLPPPNALDAREVVERHAGHVSTSGSRASSCRTAPSQYALRRVLAQQRPSASARCVGRESRPVSRPGREDVVGEAAHALERRGLVARLARSSARSRSRRGARAGCRSRCRPASASHLPSARVLDAAVLVDERELAVEDARVLVHDARRSRPSPRAASRSTDGCAR